MASFPPTSEQQAAIDAFGWGVDMKLDAYAGTGKTSTLKLLGATTSDTGVYLAFNSAIAAEARDSFPPHIQARTTHSFAFRWMSEQWGDALGFRLNGPRLRPMEVAKILGIKGPTRVGDRFLAPQQVGRLAMETIRRFCNSADDKVLPHHVPKQTGLEDHHDELRSQVLPYARKAWTDLTRKDGQLRYTHDTYLKMWSRTNPILDAEFLLVDEGQDTNGCVAHVVEGHRGKAQIVVVGDRNQAIYGFRGSLDFLTDFEVEDGNHLYLTRSWRFGAAVAEEANKWLTLLGATKPLEGAPGMSTMCAPLAQPDAILCRTNGEAVSQLMAYQAKGISVCVVGGGEDFKRLAEAAQQLKAGERPWHPELAAFESWAQLQDYVDAAADGGDLKVAVKLVDEHGAEAIIQAIDHQADEKHAQVVVSTAHKAKGREWGRVKIAEDFRRPKDDDGDLVLPSRAEMMLAYVAVTRARQVLDPAGLAWVNEYIAHLAAGRRIKTPDTGAFRALTHLTHGRAI